LATTTRGGRCSTRIARGRLEKAKVQRVFRKVDDPNHVFVFLEFASVEDADEARRRLVDSGVLDRFEDKDGPNVVQEG
jgi:nitrate reductase assembly molybdenum cofactor insertion protein NarJ